MTTPFVSVIIPCYNSAAYVGDAIESVLGQSYGHREVVVVDDGSTDDSVEVLKSFGHRIRWETGPNRGACAARNRGLELAQGEIVQFLDADDLLDSRKLKRQVPELVRGSADVVFCDFETHTDVSGAAPVRDRPHQRDAFSQACVDRIQTAAPLHWRDNLLQAGGFDESLPCAQERDLHLRLACMGYRFQHFPETLVTVRRREGSLSSDSLKVLDQHLKIVRRGYRILVERNAATDERCRVLAGVLARDARAYLRYGKIEKAAEYFSAAREIHPGGGLDSAYSPSTRALRHCLGPRLTEQLVGWRRRMRTRAS